MWVSHRYIQSTCATSGEGLYEGLDWLSSNISKKVSWVGLLQRLNSFTVICEGAHDEESNWKSSQELTKVSRLDFVSHWVTDALILAFFCRVDLWFTAKAKLYALLLILVLHRKNLAQFWCSLCSCCFVFNWSLGGHEYYFNWMCASSFFCLFRV